MKLCPQCQTVYEDDGVFCILDGTLLLVNDQEIETKANPISAYPQFSGNLPHTIQIGQSDIPSNNDTVTLVQPSFTSPNQHVEPQSNTNKNIIIAVLGVVSALLLAGIFIMNSGTNSDKNKSSSDAEREGVSAANSNNNGTKSNNSNSETSDESDTVAANDKKKIDDFDKDTPEKETVDIGRRIPNGIEQQYVGSSYFPNKTIPLTLTLVRNGQSLSGTAQTPGELDYLNGIIQPNGSFSLAGNNQNAGRVTGTWRGKISESGQISGVWTSTINGSKVRFSAQ